MQKLTWTFATRSLTLISEVLPSQTKNALAVKKKKKLLFKKAETF